MSGSEEKKLNSLHEEDSLYKAQGGKAAYQISPTYGQNTLYKVNPVHDAWDRALAAESICQDILSSARNQLYLNMRFMDCALSALFFQGDMGVHPVLPGGDSGDPGHLRAVHQHQHRGAQAIAAQ